MNVIHVKEMGEFQPCAYIGRAAHSFGLQRSPFANPYKVGPHDYSLDEALALYRIHLVASFLFPLLPTIRNARALACWCRHSDEEKRDDNRCHADVLIDLLDRYSDETLTNSDNHWLVKEGMIVLVSDRKARKRW